MSKRIAYGIFILFSFGVILINIPVEDLAYGVNEYKKNIFIFYFSLIALSFFLFKFYANQEKVVNLNYFDLILLLIFAYNSFRVLSENDYQIKKIFILWVAIIFYYFYKQSIHQLDKKEIIQRLIFLFITACFLFQLIIGIMQLIGFYQSYNAYFEITGTFENPGPYAIFLASTFTFWVTYYFLTIKSKLFTRLFFIPICIITLCFLVIILSRSALIGLIFSFYLFTYTIRNYSFHSINYLKRIRQGIILLLIAFFSITYFIKKDSAVGRAVIWKISEKIVASNPILGIGFNKLSLQYNLYQSKYFEHNPERKLSEGFYVDNTKVIFNDFYQILCEQGIFGLMLIFLLVYKLSKVWNHIRFQKSNTEDSSILILSSLHGIVVLLCAGLFDDVLEQFPLQILFYYYLSIVSSFYVGNTSSEFTAMHIINKTKFANLINLFLLFLLFFMSFKTYKLHLVLQNVKKDIASNEIYTPINNLPLDNDYYIVNKSESLITNLPSADAILFLENSKKYSSNWKLYVNLGIIYRENKDYKNAEMNFLIAHNMIPHLVYPKFLLAKVYLESNQMAKWMDMANRILTEKEKIPSGRVDGMRNEIRELLRNSK